MLSVLCTACGKNSVERNVSTDVQLTARAVFVNGALYLDTGNPSVVEGRCGVMDGEITDTVSSSALPTKNDQSNFGTGFGYQWGADDTLEIEIDDEFVVFETRTSAFS